MKELNKHEYVSDVSYVCRDQATVASKAIADAEQPLCQRRAPYCGLNTYNNTSRLCLA